MITTLNSMVRRTRSDRPSQSARRLTVIRESRERVTEFARDELDAAVRSFGPRFLAVAQRFLTCEAECADAVQDAFVSAWRQLPNFRGNSKLETWLHRIVVNACLMRLRAKSRHAMASIDELSLPVEGALQSPSIDQAETRRIVRDAVSRLPEQQRTVIQLRYFDGLNTEEAAELLGTSAAVVKTRLHRSRRALRQLLEEKQINES